MVVWTNQNVIKQNNNNGESHQHLGLIKFWVRKTRIAMDQKFQAVL